MSHTHRWQRLLLAGFVPLILLAAGCGGGGGGGDGGAVVDGEPVPSPQFTVGGSVSGLTGSGLVLANGADTIAVAARATSFTLPTALAGGSPFSMTVLTQPTGQTCSVASGSGVVGNANVNNVVVTCSANAFTLGGSIAGLTRSGLVLANGADTIAVAAKATSFTLPTALAGGSPFSMTVLTQPTGQTCSVANGSGTVGNANVNNVVVTCSANAFTLGGSIDGLTGSGLVLANGSDTLAVGAGTTSFTLPAPVAFGGSYSVTVLTQPAGQTCSVAGGNGTMGNANVTNIGVSCGANSFTLGGSITGLTSSGLVLANGSDTLAVAPGATSFTLPTAVDFGSTYSVTVQTQPTGLTCSIAAGSGTMGAANLKNVAVTCSANAFTLGGSIGGLSTAGLVLANGSDTLAVAANGTGFTMPTPVAFGGSYAVTVRAQPEGLICSVANGSGTMGAASVNNVAVTCSARSFTLGGSISGLIGSGLVLANGSDTLAVAANATVFTMPAAVAFGASYNVTVAAQPADHSCIVDNGSGSMGAVDVASVSVVCVASTFAQEAHLKAANAEADDNLGSGGVALSGDTLVIGTASEDSNQRTITHGGTASANNSAASAGAAYVFVRSGGTWQLQAYLKAPNAETGDNFGFSVAIDGDTIVVGAIGEDSNQKTVTNGPTASGNNSAALSGAAYVFVRSGSTWTAQAYLKAPNAQSSDQFGHSVAISGNTIVVGSILEDSNQTTITNGPTASADNSALNVGAAYVFVRSGSTWAAQAYLKAPNAQAGDEFGGSLAISGNTIVVGARREDSNQTTITSGNSASADNSADSAGAAYVFVRSGSTWAAQAYLKAPNAQGGDLFGDRVAIDGDTIVVGAFAEDSSQTTITNGPTTSADNAAGDAGAAYVFVRSGETWTAQAYLKAPNADADDQFGFSVGISGDTIVVGATREASSQTTISHGDAASADNSASRAGAAYVFTRNGSTWRAQAYLKAPNAEADDLFGRTAAISGNTVVAAAQNESSSQTTITNGSTASPDNSTSHAGAAYVFVFGP